eukprot:9406936-Lingulodinium_polyedra.AAC.1
MALPAARLRPRTWRGSGKPRATRSCVARPTAPTRSSLGCSTRPGGSTPGPWPASGPSRRPRAP